MSLPIHKTVTNPRHISILGPTRERPERLRRLLDSLEDTTADKSALDVWFYVDDDDAVTRKQIDDGAYDRYSLQIHWLIESGGRTQGQMVHAAVSACASGGGIFMCCPDDYRFVTPRWDEVVRDCFDAWPDRMLLAFPEDPLAGPDQLTFAIVSAEWINAVGHLLPGHFPFWYGDWWISQVGLMAQRRVQIDMRMEPQGGKGKTLRMRNVVFWHRFYLDTADDRLADASKLVAAIHGQGSAEYQDAMVQAGRLAKQFRADDRKKPLLDVIEMERELSSVAPRSKPDAGYLAMEARAVQHLWRKVGSLVRRGRLLRALRVVDTILCSYRLFSGLQYRRTIALGMAHRGWVRVRNKLARALRRPPADR